MASTGHGMPKGMWRGRLACARDRGSRATSCAKTGRIDYGSRAGCPCHQGQLLGITSAWHTLERPRVIPRGRHPPLVPGLPVLPWPGHPGRITVLASCAQAWQPVWCSCSASMVGCFRMLGSILSSIQTTVPDIPKFPSTGQFSMISVSLINLACLRCHQKTGKTIRTVTMASMIMYSPRRRYPSTMTVFRSCQAWRNCWSDSCPWETSAGVSGRFGCASGSICGRWAPRASL